MSGETIYTPPVGQKLLIEKLNNWAEFMHRNTEIDPLVRMAVQHYQFEAIHPFEDGNGRTGRILNILFLVEHGLLDPGTVLHGPNPRWRAKVRADGTLISSDVKGSIHQVGAHLQGAPSCNGWAFWHFDVEGTPVSIDVLRQKLRAKLH